MILKKYLCYLFLPSAIADSVNSLFPPPASYDASSGMYIVDCSAKTPEFGFTINNTTFYHNGEDLIYQTSDGACMSSLVSSESVSIGRITLNIVGVSFLKNVVAVFDFGRNEMKFKSSCGRALMVLVYLGGRYICCFNFRWLEYALSPYILG